MTTHGSFIELNRKFRPLKHMGELEEAALESYVTSSAFGLDKDLDWAGLLKESRVIILGEPGSGKTWEMREQARRLNDQGEFAFFVRLDQLIHSSLASHLSHEDSARLHRWKESSGTAFFFLDSVDEAKFQRISDFQGALSRFSNELTKDLLYRARITLSSRISEWKPSIDEPAFLRHCPLPQGKPLIANEATGAVAANKQKLLVVQLEPLTPKQVEAFAANNGVSDVRAFISAIENSFAWEFARRPLDAMDMVQFWQKKGVIGTLTEMIEFDIDLKISARGGRDELPLSQAESHEGVKWLAAASIFSRKFLFNVLEDGQTAQHSLNPRACLPAVWNDDKVRALLNRAIFDSALYGNLRFHHRRISEYLAAKWIADRMQNGCPPYVLEQLLVAIVRGRRVVRPALRPVVAWLCYGNDMWNQWARNLVVCVDPCIHLRYGDPSRLSVEYRRQVLASISQIAKQHRRMWIDSSSDCLARLAHPGIAQVISSMIDDRTLSADFREELLGIVEHGPLEACADSALSVITSGDEEDHLTTSAVSAIAAINDASLHAHLIQALFCYPHLSNRLCSCAVRECYPKSMTAVELVKLLERTDAVQKEYSDLPFYLSYHLKEVVTQGIALDLLRELCKLLRRPPLVADEEDGTPVSKRFFWVGSLVLTVLECLLKKLQLSPEETKVSANALYLLGGVNARQRFRHHEGEDINKLTLRHPGVRQQFFWLLVNNFRNTNSKEPTTLWDICLWREALLIVPEDFAWFVEDARHQPAFADRELAMKIAIEVGFRSGRKFKSGWRLYRAVSEEPLLRRRVLKALQPTPILTIKGLWWHLVHSRYGRWWWWRERWRKIDGKRQWMCGQFRLLTHLRLLESGRAVGWLMNLSREADEPGRNCWTPMTWSRLEKSRGTRIMVATQRGCMAAWRQHKTPLPHEKEQPRAVFGPALVGLAGLQLEYERAPSFLSRLTEGEAQLATRHAIEELNDFPSWFSALAQAHKKCVGDILWECIVAEWQFPAEAQAPLGILSRLAWHGEEVVHLVIERLGSKLQDSDPQNISILQYALSILIKQRTLLDQLSAIVASRCDARNDTRRSALWFAVLLQIDGDAAVTRLEKVLGTNQASDDLVVSLCSVLSGEGSERGLILANPSYQQPSCLRRLIPLVYRHVRESDDIDRANCGGYSPTVRDDAQHFRGALLSLLSNSADPCSFSVLEELAGESSMAWIRDWIFNLIDKKLLKQADLSPWTSADLREFAEHYEVTPRNDRELFSIAMNRLRVLKWEVEQSDNSSRTELHVGYPETELRRWLQRKLLERSRGRYTVPQEAEIDQQERPDLRLERPGIDPVSVEIKWAENWTLPELLERLENQLCGQYLRAYNSRCGVYVLGYIGKKDKQHWVDPETGVKLTFQQVVDNVRERANVLLQTNSKIADLEVVSLDFRMPGSYQAS